MNDYKRMKAVIVRNSAIFLFFGILCNSHIALAGNINGNEASVISVARGTFEYEGKMYVANESYINKLIARLSEDEIDLTEAEAEDAISQIYENVETGVREGYIELKNDSENNDEKTSTNQKDNKNTGKSNNKKNQSTNAPSETQIVDNSNDSQQNKEEANPEVVYHAPKMIKETGFAYDEMVTALCVLGVVFLVSVFMAIPSCQMQKEERVNE